MKNLVSGQTWGGGRRGSEDSASATTDPEATTKHSRVLHDHIQDVDVFFRFVTRNCLIHPADFIFIITNF